MAHMLFLATPNGAGISVEPAGMSKMNHKASKLASLSTNFRGGWEGEVLFMLFLTFKSTEENVFIRYDFYDIS